MGAVEASYSGQSQVRLVRSTRVQVIQWSPRSMLSQRQEVLVGDMVTGRVPCC